ncbi:uncharacterized protein ACBR49_007055 [Aulostomus maculatus]
MEVCYGESLRFSFDYTPPVFSGKLAFTPNSGTHGTSRKLLMDNGEPKDPRMRVTYTSVTLLDLTHRDEGTYSVSFGDSYHDIFSLVVLDCSVTLWKHYGETFHYYIQSRIEYVEFSPPNFRDETTILWNRTNHEVNRDSRLTLRGNNWKFTSVTELDSGHYNFRSRDNILRHRLHLTVSENTATYRVGTSEELFIAFPESLSPWTIVFVEEHSMDRTVLMREGVLLREDFDSYESDLIDRIQLLSDGMIITNTQSTDAGVYKIMDEKKNLASVVTVVVYVHTPTYVYIVGGSGIIFVVAICCCCFKKCCCKKSSPKHNAAVPQSAETPAVYYHGPRQPSSSRSAEPPAANFSDPPSNQPSTAEPMSFSFKPPAYADIHVNPPIPEVAGPAGQGAFPPPSVGAGFLSSDPEPRFELKLRGQAMPSAPLFSLDSNDSDVYTSDKLNFL